MPPKKNDRSIRAKDGCATHRLQRGYQEQRQGLGAVEDELMGRGEGYRLVCEKEEEKVVRGSEMAARRKVKKMWERRGREMAQRKRRRACVT